MTIKRISKSNSSSIRYTGNKISTNTSYVHSNISRKIEDNAGGYRVVTPTYTYHVFDSSGELTINEHDVVAEFVMIGGGGGGGNFGGGGGGAGGLVYKNNITLTKGNYTVIVGAGGGTSAFGSNTSFLSYTAYGGGPGQKRETTIDPASSGYFGMYGKTGGCGGGACSLIDKPIGPGDMPLSISISVGARAMQANTITGGYGAEGGNSGIEGTGSLYGQTGSSGTRKGAAGGGGVYNKGGNSIYVTANNRPISGNGGDGTWDYSSWSLDCLSTIEIGSRYLVVWYVGGGGGGGLHPSCYTTQANSVPLMQGVVGAGGRGGGGTGQCDPFEYGFYPGDNRIIIGASSDAVARTGSGGGGAAGSVGGQGGSGFVMIRYPTRKKF